MKAIRRCALAAGISLTLWGCSSGAGAAPAARREEVEVLELKPKPARALPTSSSKKAADRSLRGHWYKDEAEAVELARADNRPLVIDFRAEWCAACKELQKHTFSDADVQQSFERFVLLAIDATDDESPTTKALLQKYKVVGLPAVLVIDPSGRELARVVAFTEPVAFRALIDSAR